MLFWNVFFHHFPKLIKGGGWKYVRIHNSYLIPAEREIAQTMALWYVVIIGNNGDVGVDEEGSE